MAQYKTNSSTIATCIAAAALLWVTPAAAGGNMTEAEYLMLPEFCKSQGNVSELYFRKYYSAARTQKWQAIFGSNYGHFHHYCWAIVGINRAYKPATSGGDRGYLPTTINDLMYVIDRATPDFVLLPEIYTKLGEAYLLVRDDKSAENAFRQACLIDPTYWRAYLWWSNRLFQRGKLDEALTVVEEGRKHAPDAKQLDKLADEIRAAVKAARK